MARQALILVMVVLVFGVVVPWYKGVTILQPTIVMAYALIALLFVAPAASEFWSAVSESDVPGRAGGQDLRHRGIRLGHRASDAGNGSGDAEPGKSDGTNPHSAAPVSDGNVTIQPERVGGRRRAMRAAGRPFFGGHRESNVCVDFSCCCWLCWRSVRGFCPNPGRSCWRTTPRAARSRGSPGRGRRCARLSPRRACFSYCGARATDHSLRHLRRARGSFRVLPAFC